MKRVKLFVEGGGDNNALRTECRRAFSELLERAGCKERMPRIVACGSRRNAFEQFCTALANSDSSQEAMLLVDAEAPVTAVSPWDHVKERPGDGWDRPEGATDDQLHLMVQCMEAWLLADGNALAKFFGNGFQASALPAQTARIESVDKNSVFDHLKRATQRTKTKGAYGKGAHSFRVLAELDPALVRAASPWAERFFATISRG